MEQRHIILITHDGEKTWESFASEDEALEYADKLHEQYENIETIYTTM